MAKKKTQKIKKDVEDDDSKGWCPCKKYEDEDELCVECEDCEQWWHLKCVGLEGLLADTVEALVRWRCPRCIMQSMGMGNTIIQETVKSEIEKAVPGIVKSVVEATIKAKEFKKTFADVAAGRAEQMEKKVEKTVEKTMHLAIKDNQEALLQKASQKQDAEHFEREKRKRNIVVSNLRESSMTTPQGRYASDVKKLAEILELEEKEIVRCYRAGAKRPNGEPRLLIATLITPAHAQHYHEYGSGYKIETREGKKDIWINEDLIKADRDANYNARKIMREKRVELAKKRTKQTATKDEVKKPAPSEEPKKQEPKEPKKQQPTEPKPAKKTNSAEEKAGESDVSTDSFL